MTNNPYTTPELQPELQLEVIPVQPKDVEPELFRYVESYRELEVRLDEVIRRMKEREKRKVRTG